MPSEVNLAELAAAVGELQDRQAIRDCLARYSRGVDRLDRELLISAYHPDAVDDHGKFVGTREEFADWAIAMHTNTHLTHQHCLFNQVCEIDGLTAHSETYYMFVGLNRTGRPLALSGGRYLDRLEKREGIWAIAHRVCIRDWANLDTQPDPDDLSALTNTASSLSPEIRAFMNAGARPSRDRRDPSYDRPLELDPDRLTGWKTLSTS